MATEAASMEVCRKQMRRPWWNRDAARLLIEVAMNVSNLARTSARASGGRYRKVRARLWLEPEFAALSDEEKLVALYVLSGPQTAPPGVFRLSSASAAEDLRCSARALQHRLAAAVRAFHWKYDATTRVLWMPEWAAENPPANPNGVVAWRSCFDEIPDCALKREAWTATRAFLAPRGESFLKPFPELLAEPLGEPLPEQPPNGSSNGSANPPYPYPSEGTVGPSRLAQRVATARQTDRMVASLRSRLATARAVDQ
jgi:hypothetical protein